MSERSVLQSIMTWVEQRCPCRNEEPNPCPLCGASVENLEACKSAESTFPPLLLRDIRLALAQPSLESALASANLECEQSRKTIADLREANERMREALEPFAEFISGTHPFWDDDRRIGSLNYDFDKLKIGMFRRARAALQGGNDG